MQLLDNNTRVFLELVRAGLWEKEARILPFGRVDYGEVMSLAEGQSVVGIVTAGLEHIKDAKVPQEWVLQFSGKTILIEQRNMAMNKFIAMFVDKMRKKDICILLIKGQGVAQCYERPLWRTSGDVDFLMSDDYYVKAKEFLTDISSCQKSEGRYSKHLGLCIDKWYVEIHGSMRCGFSSRVDRMVDIVKDDLFFAGNVRTWDDDGTIIVFLSAPTSDVFWVFTHILQHLYKGGLVLKQICDWVRLLWTNRETVNKNLLGEWIKQAGIMLEWKAFGSFVVDYLGVARDCVPFYDEQFKERGNLLAKCIIGGLAGKKIKNIHSVAKVFPRKVFIYFPGIVLNLNWLKVKERILG